MIIVEGPDNTGKTTLCHKLSNSLRIPLEVSTRADSDQVEHPRIQLAPKLAIKDRVFAISELVYGPIVRGGLNPNYDHGECLRELLTRPYLIIYCKPSVEAMLNNNGRPQMEGVEQNWIKIRERYDRIMVDISRFGSGQLLTYNWEVDNYRLIEEACKVQVRKMMQIEEATQWLTKFQLAH